MWQIVSVVMKYLFLGGSPGEFGLGYQVVNILIFVIIQPSLALVFLYCGEKKKSK